MHMPRTVVLPNVMFVALSTVVGLRPVASQSNRPTVVETEMAKDPGGTPILHIPKGTRLAIGPANGAWVQATIDGWAVASAIHDDKRDGFDVSVTPAAGTPIRDKPAGGTTLASARLGALFDRVEERGGWVHVKRTGWVPVASVTVATLPPAPAAAPPPATPAAATTTTVAAGGILSSQAGGSPVATLEAPLHADVIERKNGWAHVRIDAWVRDAALGNAPAPDGITAAAIRAAPDKYIGQTVEWTIQVIGVQKADELRPELPAGQPYVLARGPLPESGFIYLAITNDDADAFRRLEPLAKIRVRATVRAGRSRFLPTPVLNFVRRLD
jgi:hypothetical protein